MRSAQTPMCWPPTWARITERAAFMEFFFEVLVGGLLAGVMYSLVAIGFVLIYKASGIFNYAQGALVLFGALTYVCLVERGLNPWFAFGATFVVLIVIALATERLVLRPL